jgi:hypothetical protein
VAPKICCASGVRVAIPWPPHGPVPTRISSRAELGRLQRDLLGDEAADRDAEHIVLGQAQRLWLVSFIDYDLGYFDHETCRLEPLDNPFGPKVLPMSPE